jgi:hypothetical protein
MQRRLSACPVLDTILQTVVDWPTCELQNASFYANYGVASIARRSWRMLLAG